jgi:protein TonB
MRTALLASVLAHTALIGLAVDRATGPRVVSQPRERVTMVRLSASARTAPEDRSDVALAAPPRGFQIVIAPLDQMVALPPINVSRLATNELDFSGRGVAGGVNRSVQPTETVESEPLDDARADLRAALLPDQMGPRYPDSLRDEAPDGTVIVRFVIDTTGRVETPSLSVLEATHQPFAEAVRAALDRLAFSPAQVAGHKVRVRVVHRFEFHFAGP